MTGSLDRLIEQGLASRIDAQSTGIQCVANLLAGGESNATLPRVVVTCESEEGDEFQETPDGIYGIYRATVIISSIADATSPTSSTEMEEMNSAIDDILNEVDLAATLTSGSLKVYGIVPEEFTQEFSEDEITRHRRVTIWARIQ